MIMLKLTYLRPEVLAFAFLMEDILRENDNLKGKEGWKGIDIESLSLACVSEVQEMLDAVRKYKYNAFSNQNNSDAVCEAADVANYCMMIADNLGWLSIEGAKKLIQNEVISENIRINNQVSEEF